MSSTPAPSLFQQAFEHHRHGRLHEAGRLYRQVLQAVPQHADALHLLGVIALQTGDFAAAAQQIAVAVALAPTAHRCSDLGNAQLALGRRDEAIASYRQALALQENLAEAHCNLSNALLDAGEVDAALASGQRAVALKPTLADAHGNLGNALLRQGRPEQALACYAQALQLRPGMAVVQVNRGDALSQLGRDDEAFAAYQQALAGGLQSAELHAKLARAHKRAGRPDTAVAHALQALARSERAELRAEFVQLLHDLHFATPQPALRTLLQRALDEDWADPAELLTPVLSLIECAPALQAAIAWAQQAAPGERLAAPLLDAVQGDALLLALLPKEPVSSVALERLLTRLRALALDDVLTSSGPDRGEATPFALALAQQGFVNEYVWACSEAEARQLGELRARLDAAATAGATPPSRALLVWASYAPLAELRGVGLWDVPVALAGLWRQQVDEPAEEHRLAAALPRLGTIDDPVSQRVQHQYEAHPYPRWRQLAAAIEPCDLATRLRRECPAAPAVTLPPGGPLQVLVAGCGTGQHPIQLARQLRDAQLLAVDLSRASLAYAQRMSQALGLTQIRYAQADLLALGDLPQRFDLIESAGVLHHLADPLAGWHVLAGLLRPGGLMRLALYSELGRREVVAVRAWLAAHRGGDGLPGSTEQIRRCRQALMQGDPAAVLGGLLHSRDFYTTSACRDLLFHVQEHRFTLPPLQQALDRLGLQFLGFAVDADVAAAYRREFPDDPARTRLDHWHAFETARPDTFRRMYQFWLRRPD